MEDALLIEYIRYISGQSPLSFVGVIDVSQTDLMHMKTWITNFESMMTEGVTDVNFTAEQWQSFASQNPLMIALTYRTQSLDQVINMNPLFNPGGIGGANPYTLSGLYLTSQQPLGTFGLSGAMVSTNFVSFMKQKEKEVAKELTATATTVDNVKEEENGFLNFLGDVGSGATKVGKGLLDFLILDDVNTLTDKDASGLDKGIALASFIPIGKVLKIPKAIDKIVDSNVGEVVKKSDVDEVVEKGIDNPLLPSEGKVGTFKELAKKGTAFDNITPHHMPSAAKMKQAGVKRSDGVSMNMEQPHPGVGGRHRETYTYGLSGNKLEEYLNLSYRDALTHDILDARRIYMKQGVYTPEIRAGLLNAIRKNRELYPELFNK
ncbi:MAG: hypothetical protein ABS960_03110 [Solibacillus isronensis]